MSQKRPLPGLSLRSRLTGHTQSITRIAWSPDGHILASPSEDGTILLWDTAAGTALHMLSGHTDSVNGVAWSPDSRVLASASDDTSMKLWDTQTGQCLKTLRGHTAAVTSVAYAPDGQTLASGSADTTIKLWDVQTGRCLDTITDHEEAVKSAAYTSDGQCLASGSEDGITLLWDTCADRYKLIHGAMGAICLAWSLNGQLLATGSDNGIIGVWNVRDGEQHILNEKDVFAPAAFLEGHTDRVTSLSFSGDGRLLASKSRDDTVRLWRTDSWEMVAVIKEPGSGKVLPGIGFHPTAPILATLGGEDTVILVWQLDLSTLLSAAAASSSCMYRNAKVVLVGDSGVGKTGLGLVLTGKSFVPTESTHARQVWTFDNCTAVRASGGEEIREILLWDLAGQLGYRLIHQLHLNEVTLALVVIDARSETDPFAGVHYWNRALRMAQRSLEQRHAGAKLKKFLVSARIDRGGVAASRERIEKLVMELHFDSFFETSAKEHRGIAELAAAIRNAIDWERLTTISSTYLFREIKDFLIAEKEAGTILIAKDDLYRKFLNERRRRKREDLQEQFEICVEQMETRGLIRRLNVGDQVLLQPELIDDYGSALVNSVKDEPEGFGSIEEEKVRAGEFAIPVDVRLSDRQQEQLLLISMVEYLLRNDIALRERTGDGVYLVFPSQSTREYAELPDTTQKTVVFRFDGPVQIIYATLAVRLSHSGLFLLRRKELWRNAITYKSETGGLCGLLLRNFDEGRGELTLFFDELEGDEIRLQFEEYVHDHLRRHALADSIQRQRIVTCPSCSVQFTNEQIVYRRERGFDTMVCNVCDTPFSIAEREVEPGAKALAVVSAMNRAADTQREYEGDVSLRIESHPRNPYYEVSGVRNAASFVGRAGILRTLFEAVARRQCISIVGSRHIGKSALLQHMHRPEIQHEFGKIYDLSHHLFVLIDLGEFLYKTSEEFFAALRNHIMDQLRERLELSQLEFTQFAQLGEISAEHALSDFLYQITQQGFYTVLLLDGFDAIIRNKSFDRDFLNRLRALASVGEVSYVIASVAPLNEICHKELVGSPFFNIFYPYTLKELQLEEARQMVQRSSHLLDRRFRFTDAEIAWVLSLAGRHPFFIQRVCYFLFEEKIAGGEATDLNKVKGRVYSDLLPHFNLMWEHISTKQQQELLKHEVLRGKEGAPMPASAEFSEGALFRDFVREKAGRAFFQLTVEELVKALEYIGNPAALGASPLRHLHCVVLLQHSHPASMSEVGLAIQDVLKEAWERLHGSGERLDYAPDWRLYNILYYQYFEHHLMNYQIANRLAISSRQYYRDRDKAIELLLSVLLEMEALAQMEREEK